MEQKETYQCDEAWALDDQLLWNPVALCVASLWLALKCFKPGQPAALNQSPNKNLSRSTSPQVFPMCVASPFSYYGHWHIWMACISYIGTWNQRLGRAKAEQRHSCRQCFCKPFTFYIFLLPAVLSDFVSFTQTYRDAAGKRCSVPSFHFDQRLIISH